MQTKEETIKQLQAEVNNNLKEISDALSKRDPGMLNAEIDNRLALSNNSFLEEIKNLSLVTVTAAPFSLTLLLSGLEIETFLKHVRYASKLFQRLKINLKMLFCVLIVKQTRHYTHIFKP